MMGGRPSRCIRLSICLMSFVSAKVGTLHTLAQNSKNATQMPGGLRRPPTSSLDAGYETHHGNTSNLRNKTPASTTFCRSCLYALPGFSSVSMCQTT